MTRMNEMIRQEEMRGAVDGKRSSPVRKALIGQKLAFSLERIGRERPRSVSYNQIAEGRVQRANGLIVWNGVMTVGMIRRC